MECYKSRPWFASTLLVLIFVVVVTLGSLLVMAVHAAPGDLDLDFGDNGIVTLPIGPSASSARSIAIQPDEKIVLAGWTVAGYMKSDIVLVRYTPSGVLDLTFGSSGIVTTTIGDLDNALAVALQSDGKIVVAGYASTSGSENSDFVLLRYNSNGNLDPTFGNNGMTITPIGNDNDYVSSMTIQPDGKIIVAGSSFNGSNYDFAIVRYLNNGNLDALFGASGIVTTSIQNGDDRISSILLQPDGKIVVAGESSRVPNGSDSVFAVVRYNANGSLDSTFGVTGIVTTSIGVYDRASSIALHTGGKIVVAGSSLTGSFNNDFAVVRYTTAGLLDPTFGVGGIITTSLTTGQDIASALVVQPDGRLILAGGAYHAPDGNDFALVRYQSNGDLDPTFGLNGIITTTIGLQSRIYTAAIQNDGKLVVAGSSLQNYSGYSRFAMARYDTQIFLPHKIYLPLALKQ